MAVWPDWRSTVTFSEDGPGVTLLHESPELKVVLVGLPKAQAHENHLQLRRLVQQGHPRPVLGEGDRAAPIRPYRHAVPPSSRGHVLVTQDPCSRICYLIH